MSGQGGLLRFAPAGVLAAGLLVTMAATIAVVRQLQRDAWSQFETQSRNVERALQIRLQRINDLLLGVRSLYRGSESVTRAEFRDYVTALELPQRLPEVVALNFAEFVPGSEIRAFERRVREDRALRAPGYSSFAVSPPGDRPAYLPITFIEPETQARVLGRDLLMGGPEQAQMIAAHRDSGEVVSSGRLVPGQPGKAMAARAAVYRKGMPLDTPEERARAFCGTVGVGFSLPVLVKDAIPEALRSTLHLRVHSAGRVKAGALTLPELTEANLLLDSRELLPAVGADEKPVDRKFQRTSHVEFGGAVLGLTFAAEPTAFGPEEAWRPPFLVGLLGTLSSVLLAGWSHWVRRRQAKLEEMVSSRTQALATTSENLRAEIGQRTLLERKVHEAGQEERRRIGEELHDDIGQRLTAMGFMVESLARDLNGRDAEAAARAERIETYLSETAEQARSLAKGIYPTHNAIGGLNEALERLAERMREDFGIDCRVQREATAAIDAPELSMNLYRIAQEAVGNAVRHGRAKTVTIAIGGDNKRPKLVIADDGVGFDFDSAKDKAGIGFQIMRHRCDMSNLSLHVERSVSGGTVIRVG